MIVGIALIGVERKQRLLDILSVAMETVSRATRFVVRLTPYGIFAIAANASGTLNLEQVGRIQVYLITYVVMALLLAIWVLPGLVSTLIPVSWREIFSSTRDGLITAFIAGDLFIVLPFLIEACKQTLERCHAQESDASNLPEVIVPASFNFPHTGKLLSLSFILFAGWFADANVSHAEYPSLALTGVLTFFGSLNAAVPFLLDLFRIPADTFQLFLATGVINSRFGALLAGVHTVTIALLGSAAIAGLIRFEPARVIRYVSVTVLLTALTVGGLRFLNSTFLRPGFRGADIVYGMQPVFPVEDSGALAPEPTPSTPGETLPGVVGDIRARGVLRIGYFPQRFPYAFRNQEGALVGFDVEMGRLLAKSLRVRPEFLELDALDFTAAMSRGECDIAMTGWAVTPDRELGVLLSQPYLDETLGFVVLDHRRGEFSSWDSIRALGAVQIGVPDVPYYVDIIRNRLPEADIELITNLQDYLGTIWKFEAVVLPAERGSVLTLLNPKYSVAVPEPGLIKIPLAYPIARRDRGWADLVNTFVELKRKDGTIDALYDDWILGRNSRVVEPRWSVVRNVLHWVN